MYIDELSTVDDLYKLLTEKGDAKELSEILHRVTNYSLQYCNYVLGENNNDIFKSYKQIIEYQLKDTKLN